VVRVQVELNDDAVTGPDGLLERLGALTDPRARRGRRHQLAGVLAIAAAAVLGGARSYSAIAEFARDLEAATLAQLGVWRRPYSDCYVAPSEPTLRRTIQQVDADALDRVVGGWLAEQQPAVAGEGPEAVAVDGKALRGAVGPDGRQVHLLAALAHGSGTVLAQRQVDAKSNEITGFRPLLDEVDLEGKVVTADALHTVKATAEFICEHGGEFVLPVKENRKALFDALNGLPWQEVPIAHPATDRGHGRITTRTIQVLPAPEDLPFPHVSQVLLIERYVTDLDGKPVSAVAAFGVASPAADRASAADLAHHVREQWSIESLHWLRDTLYQEDKSQVRTRSGPRIMAALRNVAICALRLAGRTDVTEATRWASRSMDRPFTILGLTQ